MRTSILFTAVGLMVCGSAHAGKWGPTTAARIVAARAAASSSRSAATPVASISSRYIASPQPATVAALRANPHNAQALQRASAETTYSRAVLSVADARQSGDAVRIAQATQFATSAYLQAARLNTAVPAGMRVDSSSPAARGDAAAHVDAAVRVVLPAK